MKLIEALKQIQALTKKAEDLRNKVHIYGVHMDYETPMYADQKKKVAGWVQAHGDIIKEILRLRIAIQVTNLETTVAIELNSKAVEHNIAEWIHRRRDLAKLQCTVYEGMTDKKLKEGRIKQGDGQERDVKIVRYYDPEEKDKNIEALSNEPLLIDSRLEVVNAVTDLIE